MRTSRLQPFRRIAVLLAALAVATTSAYAQNLTDFDLAGLHRALPNQKQRVVVLGSSAQPPTYSHGGLILSLQAVLHADQMVFAPTRPYKQTSEQGMAGYWMAQESIRHFDEVLQFWKTPHSQAQTIDDQTFRYRTAENQEVTVLAADTEYSDQHPATGNTLYFIDQYRRSFAGSDASRLFWIAGADSFRGIESWTPDWKKMFDHAHWVIVERVGEEQWVNVDRPHALQNALSPAGMLWFDQTHVQTGRGKGWQLFQRRLDPAGPSVLVVRVPSLDVSSTQARAEIQKANWAALDQMVQPSVVKFVRNAGYYCSQQLLPRKKEE